MAVRRTGSQQSGNRRKKPQGRAAPRGKPSRVSVSTVFWILFFVVLVTAFFALLPTVKKGVTERNQMAVERSETPGNEENPVISVQPSTSPPRQDPPATPSSERTPAGEAPVVSLPPAEQVPQERPGEQAGSEPPVSDPAERPAETRDRGIYFMQEIGGGAELRLIMVNRRLPVSGSPLLDSLNALLAGPTADERTRYIINLISPNTRLVSVPVIRGNTAYIDFSEDFQYNPDGREGLTAQLRQIVWTATEFSNVHDVQILIEGQRVDFLSEGIMIGRPLRR